MDDHLEKVKAFKLALEISDELWRARLLWPNMNTPHEGISVIREEYLELEREVFKKQTEYNRAAMRKEAIHIAAMAMRFIIDLLNEPVNAKEKVSS